MGRHMTSRGGTLSFYASLLMFLTTALIHSLADGSSVFPQVTQLRVGSETGLGEFTALILEMKKVMSTHLVIVRT